MGNTVLQLLKMWLSIERLLSNRTPMFVTNLSSLEIRVSTYISAKLKKRTYMYDSLQFTVEINTRGSKTLTTFIPFHMKCDLQEQFGLFSHSYLQNGML